MRYFVKPEEYTSKFGQLHFCEHPVYTRCTLYIFNEKGFAIIQQFYNPSDKSTYWKEIEPWLTDPLYLSPGFDDYFNKIADFGKNGIFPTVTIRQAMRALGLPPLQRREWETYFDRRRI